MDVQALLDSIPTPSPAEMAERRKLARRYTLVFLRQEPAHWGELNPSASTEFAERDRTARPQYPAVL
jgi:hypothetical protein